MNHLDLRDMGVDRYDENLLRALRHLRLGLRVVLFLALGAVLCYVGLMGVAVYVLDEEPTACHGPACLREGP